MRHKLLTTHHDWRASLYYFMYVNFSSWVCDVVIPREDARAVGLKL